jgi:hypothetical protein
MQSTSKFSEAILIENNLGECFVHQSGRLNKRRRTRYVVIMSQIYERAQTVFICLGTRSAPHLTTYVFLFVDLPMCSKDLRPSKSRNLSSWTILHLSRSRFNPLCKYEQERYCFCRYGADGNNPPVSRAGVVRGISTMRKLQLGMCLVTRCPLWEA